VLIGRLRDRTLGCASEHRIGWGLVEGILNPHYAHDERSFRRICDAAGVSRFQVFEREWGGRQRLFLRLDKPRP
jgi:hypothetical protein